MSSKRETNKAQLGELEAEVMNIVWEQGEATVQLVKDALAPERPLAYTTVMTVMSRLAEKGFLKRRKQGRAYRYSATSSQENLAGPMLRSLVQRLYDGAAGQAIAHLLDSDEKLDEEELQKLEDLIRQKRDQPK